MFGDRGTSFPATGLAVVVLFLTTAFLGPRAFESLRQSESDVGKRAHLAEPTVEARLWEDPLVAQLRHKEKLKGICSSSGEEDKKPKLSEEVRKAAEEKPACGDGRPQTLDMFKKGVGSGKSLTLIAALLPGATLIGGEEARRRQRYALLSGLNAAGYIPDNSDRMGLIAMPRCFDFRGCGEDKPDLEIPFETLSAGTGKDGERRRVAVLWVDDSKMGNRWLSGVAILLTKLNPGPDTRFRIVGPADSDRLANAIEDLRKLAEESQKPPLFDFPRFLGWLRFRENWATLAELHVLSPNSTAPMEQLIEAFRQPRGGRPHHDFKNLNEVFLAHLRAIQQGIGSSKSPQPKFFVPTIGTDDILIDKLIKELCARGLDPRSNGRSARVVLLAEWDSIYARTFERVLREKLESQACDGAPAAIRLESYQYLRGLDGLTLDGTPPPIRRVGEGTRNEKDRQGPPIEWPEGRDQRDYLRRLLDHRIVSNQKVSGKNAVQAIGVIGVDVHDKLLMAQAIRSAFPDRTFFTTDIDARLLHPDVLPHTRNMIVASSLPLSLEEGLQCGSAPFRDVYQAAMFLAARYAATAIDGEQVRFDPDPKCGERDFRKVQQQIEMQRDRARLFEISRDGAVELIHPDDVQATKNGKVEDKKRTIFALVSFAVLLTLGVLMTFVAPGPAMKASLPWWWKGAVIQQGPAGDNAADADQPATSHEGPRGTFVFVTAVQAAAFGFALGVLFELAFPGAAGLSGAVFGAALAAAVVCGLYLFRELRLGRADSASARARGRRRVLILALVVLAVAAVAVYGGLLSNGHPVTDLREPFAAVSGVSSWPSQLLRTLSIVLFAWFLDYALCRSASEADDIGWRYFSQSSALPNVRFTRRNIVRAIVWHGKPKRGFTIAISGARLWKAYRIRLRSWQSVVRIGVGLLFAAGLIWAARELLGGAWPEIPARGIADRQLFNTTAWIAGLLMIVMMVLVADITILTWRFIALLKEGRTFYPRSTVKRFAAELGSDRYLRMQASRTIPARLTRRGDVSGHNSLLDDWIDARLLAQHTAVIGPLIVFPFVLLALIIVSRSRFFDNWDVGGFVLIIFALFVSWAVAMAIVLNHAADRARKLALERMERDKLWLKGAGDNYKELAEQFQGLIDQVRALRQGAFAPFFEQPLVQAILVPLGGAGGIQLLDLVMQGRL